MLRIALIINISCKKRPLDFKLVMMIPKTLGCGVLRTGIRLEQQLYDHCKKVFEFIMCFLEY